MHMCNYFMRSQYLHFTFAMMCTPRSHDSPIVSSDLWLRRCSRSCAWVCLVLSTLIFFGGIISIVWLLQHDYPHKWTFLIYVVGTGCLYITTFASNALLLTEKRQSGNRSRNSTESVHDFAVRYSSGDCEQVEFSNTSPSSQDKHTELTRLEVPAAQVRKTPPPPYDDSTNGSGKAQAKQQRIQITPEAKRLLNIIYNEFYVDKGNSEDVMDSEAQVRILRQERDLLTHENGIDVPLETLGEIKNVESFIKALDQVRMGRSDSKIRKQIQANTHPKQFVHNQNTFDITHQTQNGRVSQILHVAEVHETELQTSHQNLFGRSPSRRLQQKLKTNSPKTTGSSDAKSVPDAVQALAKNSPLKASLSCQNIAAESPSQQTRTLGLDRQSQHGSSLEFLPGSVQQFQPSTSSDAKRSSRIPTTLPPLPEVSSEARQLNPRHQNTNITMGRYQEMTAEEWIVAWNLGLNRMKPKDAAIVFGARV